MSVRTRATSVRPEMFGKIIGFASRTDTDTLIIETDHGKFYVHDSEIVEFFPVG